MNIRHERMIRGIQQKDMSKAIGLTNAYYCQVEKGNRPLTEEVMVRVEKFLNEYDGATPDPQYDVVNKPEHYHKGGVDVIGFVEGKVPQDALEGFYQINVIKYVTRYRDKNGLEDLKKAQFYLNKLIETKGA